MSQPRVTFKIDMEKQTVHFTVVKDVFLQPVEFDFPFVYQKAITAHIMSAEAKQAIAAMAAKSRIVQG